MLPIKERRHFVRHPVCYPLEFEYAPKNIRERSHATNISEGGLLFLSKHHVHCGKIIILRIPIQNKLLKVRAKVMHVKQDPENSKLYDIGVSFYRYSDAFRVKLIEQIYLIDEYRAIRSVQLGREVSFKEASRDWIKRYSKKFDRLFWGSRAKKKKSSQN